MSIPDINMVIVTVEKAGLAFMGVILLQEILQ